MIEVTEARRQYRAELEQALARVGGNPPHLDSARTRFDDG